MKELANVALETARGGGATYADIRFVRHRDQSVRTREERVEHVADSESFGFGVRVVLDGAWGFAASHVVEKDNIAAVTRRALAMAKANAAMVRRPVQLHPVEPCETTWESPMEKDPFEVPLAEKADLLLAANAAALKVQGAKFCSSWMLFRREEKFFASTDGSYITQRITRSWPCLVVTAVDSEKGEFQSRRADIAPMGLGYEHVERNDLVALAPRMAEQAVEKLRAKSVEPGRRDLILHPTNLWLTIHESVGHPTELDRAVGLEANYAGTSFLTLDKLGRLQYGSEIVNFKADKTIPGGMATCAFDDDGVPTEAWYLVKDGLFVDYQTVRDQVAWPEYRLARAAAGLPEATRGHAAAYADSWASFPFQRNVNIHLEAGKKPLSLDDLIASTDDGVYIIGDGSFSIDHQRYNFQFSGQVFYEIKGGKITGMLKDVAYQANTLDFWRSCDAICDERFWEMGATFHCGKGQPPQSSPCSHGSAPARFRNINILNTRREL